MKSKIKRNGTETARKPTNSSQTLGRAQFRAISKALSDPRRYEILQHIAGAKVCTCADLRESSPISAATLSHHLKELEAAGLITIARRGKFALPAFRREVWKSYLAQLGELSEG
jgi:ArsR family transcriptional regulator, arsenate/arsenite/antimonite-responsive transcriptional repressor